MRATCRARLQDQHSDMFMPFSFDDNDAYDHRRPGCRKRSRTVHKLDLNSVPRAAQLLHDNVGHHARKNMETALIELYLGTTGRSLQIMEARGHVPLHTELPEERMFKKMVLGPLQLLYTACWPLSRQAQAQRSA